MEDNQVEEVTKQLTASFPASDLIKNNRHIFTLLLENTSVSENRRRLEHLETLLLMGEVFPDETEIAAIKDFLIQDERAETKFITLEEIYNKLRTCCISPPLYSTITAGWIQHLYPVDFN